MPLLSPTRPLVATAVTAAFVLAVTGCAASDGPEPGDTATAAPVTADPDDGEPVNFFDLKVGDCFDIPSNFPSGEALRWSSCDVLHMFEAFAETELPAGEFPGTSEVEDAALEFCEPAFVEFVGESWTTSDFDFQFIVPSERTWGELDDRKVMCMATSLSGLPWSGSAAEGGR